MEVLRKKCLIGLIIKAIFMLLLSFTIAHAQKTKVTIKLISEDTLLLPKESILRFQIERDKKMISGHLLREAGRLLFSFPDQPRIELPRQLETMISLDGKTILQFGDEINKMHPIRTDLFWVNQAGEIVNQVQNTYAGRAKVALSDDGFTGISGNLVGETDSLNMLVLFSTSGNKIWETHLETSQRIDKLLVAPEGKYLTAIVTDKKDLLPDHRIQIWDKNGNLKASNTEMGVLQKMVQLGKTEKVFIQAYDAYGIVNIKTGELIWRRPGKIRMISPYGAALSPAGETLFLLLAEFRGQRTGIYRWKILSLNALTGDELAQDYLPEQYPSTWERVFQRVSANEIKILAGQKRISFSWEKLDGGDR